jgi:hypothetical protein
MNWKGCGRKVSWPNLIYYPGICLQRLKKTTKILSQDEVGVLTTPMRRLVATCSGEKYNLHDGRRTSDLPQSAAVSTVLELRECISNTGRFMNYAYIRKRWEVYGTENG